jgi:hypothetical protein
MPSALVVSQQVALVTARSNDYCNSTMIVSAMTRRPWRVVAEDQ